MREAGATYDLEAALRRTGAVLDGHFALSSGLHAARYFQCARLLAMPAEAEAAGAALAARFADDGVQAVVGPALGGVVLSFVVARAAGVRSLFVERGADGAFALRRGFEILPSERVLVVEDVITTGGSAAETLRLVRAMNARVVGVGALVDRAAEAVREIEGAPMRALARIPTPSLDSAACPLCKSGIPVSKPGSRPVDKNTKS